MSKQVEETYFPRGRGALPVVDNTRKRKHDSAKETDLFKTVSTLSKKKQKRSGKGAATAKDAGLKKRLTVTDDIASQKSLFSRPKRFTTQDILPDMLLLGCVKSVQEFQLIVSLANGLHGAVSIVDISESYTALLHKVANGDKIDEEVVALDKLFHIGQLVRCRVVDVKSESGKKGVKLTINPKDVNYLLEASELRSGLSLEGCVSSIEDHGYTIDLGVRGCKAFLQSKMAEKFVSQCRNGVPLRIGTHVPCVVSGDSVLELSANEGRVVQVKVDPKIVAAAKIDGSVSFKMKMFVPGMVVQGSIAEVFADGIAVKFLTYRGSIHRSHLLHGINNYKKDDEISACILSINPVIKSMTLSQLPHLMSSSMLVHTFDDVSVGDIYEEACVVKADSKHGVYFKLPNGCKAFASLKQLSDENVNIEEDFKVGSLHKCRVRDFCFVDNLVIVTLRRSLVERKFLSYGDLNAGETVECEVKTLTEKGVRVLLAPGMEAFIPQLHMADIPLQHPEKKFNKGKKLKCKVLTVDASKRRAILSHKKSLLNSKHPIITDYSQCEPGLVTEGFIFRIRDIGVLVVFYDNVKGWVPRNELSVEAIDYPEKVFYLGQVVVCRVLHCQPQNEKLLLSFKMSGLTPFGTKTIQTPDNFAVGHLTECRVTKKTDAGLDVVLGASNMAAFLPKMHLSDFIDHCSLLHQSYAENDLITDVVYIGKTNTLALSHKQSLIDAAKKQEFVEKFDDLKPGMMLVGIIKKLMPYGVFVDLLNGLIGLAPNKYLCDRFVTSESNPYVVGQSVVAKVTEVENEKQRFLVSLRMTDCFHGDVHIGLDLLATYLAEHQLLLKNCHGGDKHCPTIGSVVTVKVTELTAHGVLGQLEGGWKGLCTTLLLAGKVFEPGTNVSGVVLSVEPVTKIVELALDPSFITAAKRCRNNKSSEAKVGQTMKADVLMVTDYYILVSLRAHAAGNVAYIPAKRHLNDCFHKTSFAVGQVVSIVIKRVSQGFIMAVREQDDVKDEPEPIRVQSSVTRQNCQSLLGQTLNAVIHKVYQYQLNISINDIPGRVYISNITDQLVDGSNPLQDYQADMEITVKVLSVEDFTVKSDLPISHPIIRQRLECSLKPSDLSSAGSAQQTTDSAQQFSVGDKVQCFVLRHSPQWVWMQVTPKVKGKIHVLNMSSRLKRIENLARSFPVSTGYNATVVGILDDATLLLSLTDEVEKVEEGSVARAVVTSSHDLGLSVALADGYQSKVALTDLTDNFADRFTRHLTVDCVVRCRVLSINHDKKNCTVSLRKSRVAGNKDIKDPEIVDMTDVQVGTVLRGFVIASKKNTGIIVRLGRNVVGRVQYSRVSEYFVKDIDAVLYPGKVITAKVLSIDQDKNRVELSMLANDTGLADAIPQEFRVSKRLDEKSKGELDKMEQQKKKAKKHRVSGGPADLSLDESTPKRRKTEKVEDVDSGLETRESESETEPKKAKNVNGEINKPRLMVTAPFEWDKPFTISTSTDQDMKSDSDEEAEPKAQKAKKLTKAERKAEEDKLYEAERKMLEGDLLPTSADDFDRLLLQSPNSSIIWLRYMAFHLESAEIEKARAIAERALKSISFREEQEKLNVWMAYVNLENMYGSQESLQEVFERALQHNDPIKVFQQFITMCTAARKLESAERVYHTMIRRHGQDKTVWLGYGQLYYELGKLDTARQLMQRSLKTLVKQDHVEVISRFAQLEFKHGDPERGKTLFESILGNFPKRMDLWSVYIDLMIKLGDHNSVRQLFERTIHLKLSAKKMRFLFKKYLDFEEKFGSDSTVETVKQKAVQFMEQKN